MFSFLQQARKKKKKLRLKLPQIQSGSECELLSCRAKFWGRFGFLGGIQAHEISVQNWFSSKQPFKNS